MLLYILNECPPTLNETLPVGMLQTMHAHAIRTTTLKIVTTRLKSSNWPLTLSYLLSISLFGCRELSTQGYVAYLLYYFFDYAKSTLIYHEIKHALTLCLECMREFVSNFGNCHKRRYMDVTRPRMDWKCTCHPITKYTLQFLQPLLQAENDERLSWKLERWLSWQQSCACLGMYCRPQ